MQQTFKKLTHLLTEAEQTLKIARRLLTPPIDNVQATTEEIFAERREKMEALAFAAARELGLSNLKFISKSKRFAGAHAFLAINEKHENVVLKIQSVDEIAGYKKVQQMASVLPPDVANHLPTIHHVKPLQALLRGHKGAHFDKLEDFCAVVMERLEELPGNLFDLITKSPRRSEQSLNALLNDRKAFMKVVDNAVNQKIPMIASILGRYSIHKNVNINDAIEQLKLQIGRAMYSSASRQISNDSTLVINGLVKQTQEEIDLWCLGLGISDKASQMNISKQISDAISSSLSRRAIPIEPKRERAGPLGHIKGIDKLLSAVKKLELLGIMPSDLHGNNIMLRPDSGELVLADLGYFG